MTYEIMHKDTVIAAADESGITAILHAALCPACFAVGMPLEHWLANRCVDTHRSHSRQLFRALRLRTDAGAEALIDTGHGVCITDNWWVRRQGEACDLRELRKYNEALADIALYGASDPDSDLTRGYKELGTVGSYEKCWKFLGGSWYMFKAGNTAELISEHYAARFLEALHAPVAAYSLHRGTDPDTGLPFTYMVSRDFTDNAAQDFEPFCNYFHDHEEAGYILPRLDERLRKDYVMMLFYDVLLYNGDRHNQNAGVLRDSTTGALIGLAPYFDYNLALVSTGTPRISPESGNLLANDFLSHAMCCEILREHCPTREAVCAAAETAGLATQQALPDTGFRYALLRDYILQTFDYLTARL